MMVIFVSQCEKNALKKTRKVLDAFANRIGDNTWQSLITEDGLNMVQKLLRKTASKSTSVSCHWIRSRSRSQLMWVVGSKDKFDEQGHVPVNRTRRNIVKKHIENDWHYLSLVQALSGLAALFHDWGKASKLFQDKLSPKSTQAFKGDPLRHEWISCLLLKAFILSCGEKSWLSELAQGNIDEKALLDILNKMPKEIQLFDDLDLLARWLLWLMVSHHRLPLHPHPKDLVIDNIHNDEILNVINSQWQYANQQDEQEYQQRLKHCFTFPKGLLIQSSQWLAGVKRWANRLQKTIGDQSIDIEALASQGCSRIILHQARLCLMLGDHFYSSQKHNPKWLTEIHLYANSDKKTQTYNQYLDEHLCEVSANSVRIAHFLPSIESQLLGLSSFAHKKLKQSSPPQFGWQDKVVKAISQHLSAEKNKIYGAFVVNMASTGCGKTYANAKIMQALSHESQPLRYVLALGLRTLTLQTGDEYRSRILQQKSNEDIAVVIGSKAVSDLHQHTQKSLKKVETSGTESHEALLDEAVDYEGQLPEEGFITVLKEAKDKKFLYAPLLVCTIDHMMGATQTRRGGRYILPYLRLLSSDLVIDEVDDFTGDDVVAITHLVHLAGMLGRKVMISSATIPPAFAEGFFNAYQVGLHYFYASRKNDNHHVDCIWVDEFTAQVNRLTLSETVMTDYKQQHDQFIQQRVKALQKQPVKRRGEIIRCELQPGKSEEAKQRCYFTIILDNAIRFHKQHHTNEPKTGKTVSFGVVRMANIKPTIQLTRFLLEAELPDDIEIRVMAYHSRQVLLLRHEQEKHLDLVLKRKEKEEQLPQAFSNSVICQHIQHCQTKNLIFILVATPVEEVGRDHDFDWAIIEPSSYRSIIQLSGRVRRHRQGEVNTPNVGILQYNWKSYLNDNDCHGTYFDKPGYEADFKQKCLPKTKKVMPLEHNLMQIVDTDKLHQRIDASARIVQPKLANNSHFSLMEHAVITKQLAAYKDISLRSLQGYLKGTLFYTALPMSFYHFRRSEPQITLYLLPDEKRGEYAFYLLDEQKERAKVSWLEIHALDLSARQAQRLWLRRDYCELIQDYAKQFKMSPLETAMRFGAITLDNSVVTEHNTQKEHDYSDQFGWMTT